MSSISESAAEAAISAHLTPSTMPRKNLNASLSSADSPHQSTHDRLSAMNENCLRTLEKAHAALHAQLAAESSEEGDAVMARLFKTYEMAQLLYSKSCEQLAAHVASSKQATPATSLAALDQRAQANKEFNSLAKAVEGKLPKTYRSSQPNSDRMWHHLIHMQDTICGPDHTTETKLRLLYTSFLDPHDANRLKAFHHWPWEDCVNLIPTVLSGGIKAIHAAEEYRDFRFYVSINDVTAAQEIERFFYCLMRATGSREAGQFDVQHLLGSLPGPLRDQVFALYEIEAHNRRGSADPAVQAFTATLGRSDAMPQKPTPELIAAVTKFYNEDTHSPSMTALVALLISVCRDPPQILRARFFPTAAKLAEAEQGFARVARDYYLTSTFTPSKQVAAPTEQPSSYRAAVTSGDTTIKAAAINTSGSTTIDYNKPRSESDGPTQPCYIHKSERHLNASCNSEHNKYGKNYVNRQQMPPPTAASAPASSASPTPANTRQAPTGARNPSHGNSLSAIHHDEIPRH